MSEPLRYSIVAADPAAHVFEVTVTVSDPVESGQSFSYAAWVPGSYMIRDMARHIISIRATSGGRDIALTKTDKSSWLADPCEGPLTLTLRIYAFDENVRGAHLDNTHGYFDGACVFPAVAGHESVSCQLEIGRPPGKTGSNWRVATAMRPLNGGQYEFGTYTSDNYAELIDHPVEMGDLHIGEFEVAGVPHAIAVRGQARFDMARVCRDLAVICESQIKMLGKPRDLDRYLFLLNVLEEGYGGLEHGWSSALVCSRKDLPRRGTTETSDDYRKFLGLCSHEYFHLWNIKRIKPEKFVPYDLREESYTGLLWVFEGITSYYDKLFLNRSGLIGGNSYLELLARTITRHLRTRGNAFQSVEDSSFYAWTKFYKQHANSSNFFVSYYNKGSLVALLLDLTLRLETDGKSSLDDVMRECWSRFGGGKPGMPERGIESVARSVSGVELEDFFDRYVRGTAELPLQAWLRSFGLILHTRPATGSKDVGGKSASASQSTTVWLGASLSQNGSRPAFGTVLSDSPAERAGLAPGDEAVAIDGLRLTAANLDARLRDYQPGDVVSLTVFREETLQKLQIKLGKPLLDTAYIEQDADADEASLRRQAQWLRFNAS